MAGNAALGFATLFKREDTPSSGTYTTVAGVTNIAKGGESLEPIDDTDMENVDAYRTFIGGLLDGGEVSVDLWFKPGGAQQLNLRSDMQARIPVNYRIQFPTAINREWQFSALVISFEDEAPLDANMTLAVTLKITGKPTLVATV